MPILKVYDGSDWVEVPILDGVPGGELGGTWAAPTVDATHSGSAHHAQAHTAASHSDQGATGAELETLTDTSDADALHDHGNHGVTHNAVHGPAKHTEGGNWKLLYTDGSGDEQELALVAKGRPLLSGGAAAAPTFDTKLNLDDGNANELTISSGEITPTRSFHTVDTESDAASDDLTGITGGAQGDLLILCPIHENRTVVLKNQDAGSAAGDRIATVDGQDLTLDTTEDYAILLYNGRWDVISTNASVSTAAHGISSHTEHATWKVLYTDSAGDEQELALGADDTILESTGASSAPVMRAHEHSMGITVENPSSSEDLTIKRTDAAITVKEIHAVLRGSDTPSVTWTIRHQPAGTGSGRGATGNEVVTGGTTTTSVTAGDDVSSFNDATIPADSFVWLETTAKSGTVNEIHITIRSTFD